MGSHDPFKHNRASKNAKAAGALIFICVTLVSCFSSFMIYREGFQDVPQRIGQGLSLFCVAAVEVTLIWLLYGFNQAFTAKGQRVVAVAGIAFIIWVMLMNIMTHFMMVKRQTLSDFQNEWLSWGAISVLIATLLIVLSIKMFDPEGRLERQEMVIAGRQQMAILQAKDDALESERVRFALLTRGEREAEEMAGIIEGQEVYRPQSGTSRLRQQPQGAYFKSGKEKRR